jgi:DNA invertase Pin-like site-specific DNA recombinase
VCFAYVRISGKGQQHGHGYPRQEAAVTGYLKANPHLRIAKIFREQISGTTDPAARPVFAEILTQARLSSGHIIIEKLDRLCRDLLLQERTIADLKRQGITLISVMEPDLMASDPTRILGRQMLGCVAEYDRAQIVIKLRQARARKRELEGRCEGAKPFGFFPGETEVVDTMRRLRSEGMSYDRIASVLTVRGFKARRGRWHPYTVSLILGRDVGKEWVFAVAHSHHGCE